MFIVPTSLHLSGDNVQDDPRCDVGVFINNGSGYSGHWSLCNCHILRGRHAQPRQNWQLQNVIYFLHNFKMKCPRSKKETKQLRTKLILLQKYLGGQAARVSLWLFYAFIWFTLSLSCASSINRKANYHCFGMQINILFEEPCSFTSFVDRYLRLFPIVS